MLKTCAKVPFFGTLMHPKKDIAVSILDWNFFRYDDRYRLQKNRCDRF